MLSLPTRPIKHSQMSNHHSHSSNMKKHIQEITKYNNKYCKFKVDIDHLALEQMEVLDNQKLLELTPHFLRTLPLH